MEIKLDNKHLEHEINLVIQDIKTASESLNDGLYEKMIDELSNADDKNETERVEIITKYHKILLPQIHKESEKLEKYLS